MKTKLQKCIECNKWRYSKSFRSRFDSGRLSKRCGKCRESARKSIIKGKKFNHGLTIVEMQKKLNQIKLNLGCQNTLCKWAGDFALGMLEFHHIKDKLFELSHFHTYKTWTEEIVLSESAKCIILCANCHRLIHCSPSSVIYNL